MFALIFKYLSTVLFGCGMLTLWVTGCATPRSLPGVGRETRSSPIAASPEPFSRRLLGHLYTTRATGPGIQPTAYQPFLGGALLPETGWPSVFRDHFVPRPGRLDKLWLVQTRACPQHHMNIDPFTCLEVFRFNAEGKLCPGNLQELRKQVQGSPVFIQVQGNLTTADSALGGLLWSHTWLERQRALPPDAVLIAFDWPSERVSPLGTVDVNEKCRRAYVAGYQLAVFLSVFPSHSRVSLLGHSYGGRAILSALHLLGGGVLRSRLLEDRVPLPRSAPPLHLRAILVEAAADHHWILPGEKMGKALVACEGLLNLYNPQDKALFLYPLWITGGKRGALGRVGLSEAQQKSLGPLQPRYAQADVSPYLGWEHTLLEAVAHPGITCLLPPYTWASED